MDISTWPEALPQLLPGLKVSLQLLFAILVIGLPLALALAGGQRSKNAFVKWGCLSLVELGRGVPSLVFLYLVYFGLPSAGLTLGAFTAASIAFGINFAAYTSEAFRSGLDAVPVGQTEAAQALGLSRAVELRRVVLPQALRIVAPALISWTIVYFQMTSIAYAIAVPELMSTAYSVASVNFQYLNIFILAGLIYAAFSIPGSQLVAYLERRNPTATQ